MFEKIICNAEKYWNFFNGFLMSQFSFQLVCFNSMCLFANILIVVVEPKYKHIFFRNEIVQIEH